MPPSLLSKLKAWWKSRSSDGVDRTLAAALSTPGSGSDKVLAVLASDYLREKRSERQWRMLRRLIFYGFFIISTGAYILMQAMWYGYRPLGSKDVVAVIKIDGAISSSAMASADNVIPQLKRAFEAKNVVGVALSIDSPGGQPVEAERIYTMIHKLQTEHPEKKVVAVINNLGASAGYMIALHADQIYCGRYSLVGSIGAIVQTWDVHQLLDRLSIKRRVYASGELKSMLDPYMEPSDASNAKAQALVNNMGQFFLNDLKRIRGTKLQQNMNYGTGEVWTGEEAKNVGLVDGIGTLDEVIQATWHVQSHDFSPHHGMFSLFSDMQVAFSSALLNWTAPTSY